MLICARVWLTRPLNHTTHTHSFTSIDSSKTNANINQPPSSPASQTPKWSPHPSHWADFVYGVRILIGILEWCVDTKLWTRDMFGWAASVKPIRHETNRHTPKQAHIVCLWISESELARWAALATWHKERQGKTKKPDRERCRERESKRGKYRVKMQRSD